MTGKHIVEKKLPLLHVTTILDGSNNPDFFGVTDLLEMELFHSSHHIARCVKDKKLKCVRVNKNQIFFTREQLLEYWKNHRVPEEKKEEYVEVTIKVRKKSYESLEAYSDTYAVGMTIQQTIEHAIFFYTGIQI